MTTRMGTGGAMSKFSGVLLAATIFAGAALAAENDVPTWAYAVPSGYTPPAGPMDAQKHVPESDRTFSVGQTREIFNVPDWHPDDHAAPPDLILHGRRVEACAHCHLPNGQGSNLTRAPGLVGLSKAYMLQQFADFKSGARSTVVADYGAPRMMSFILQTASAEELDQAATYFASLTPRPWVRVVEAARVPQTGFVDQMPVALKDGGTEPIGMRIVEVPEDTERAELRDSHAGYIAYVPPGSLKLGEALATTGANGKTIACITCHGLDLRGLGPVPSLAGRSPSYIVRQMYDMQHGARTGLWTPLMIPVVNKLKPADMVAVAAYAASRAP